MKNKQGDEMEEPKPYHKRLADFESFDRIELVVVPRYKTSGLSGDEWRQHVQVNFYFKGEVVHETGFRDMEAALLMVGREWVTQQEPIPMRVIDVEKTKCDQPSCAEDAVGKYLILVEYGDRGEDLDQAKLYGRKYRQFCKRHARRGDCSREDQDANYEPMGDLTPDASTNVEELPAALAPPVYVESSADIAEALEKLRRSRE